MDYVDLIPKQPPEGLFSFLQQKENCFKAGVLAYKMVSRGSEEAYLDCENTAGDYRRNYGREKGKAALLWCSECEQEGIAEYIPGRVCNGYGTLSGVYIQDDVQQSSGEFNDGSEMLCPCCGKPVKLRSASALKYGQNEQELVVAATVEQSYPVFTTYIVERSIYDHRQSTKVSPFNAYVVDGGKMVKLVKYRRMIYGRFYELEKWEKLQRLTDNMGPAFFFNKTPSLDGTILENAKLWEYKKQAYGDGKFLPIPYIRLYQRHQNAENLIMAGMGKLLGEAMREDAVHQYNYGSTGYYKAPKLPWINWKEVRPAQMLGMTKDQFRIAKTWELDKLKFWRENQDKLRFEDAAELLKITDVYQAKKIMEGNTPPLKTARYCKKQGHEYSYLADYWHMAEMDGMDINQQEVRWPPHLQDAHDRVLAAQKYAKANNYREQFMKMSSRCQGLKWEHGGICIRPAATPDELVREGEVLHHCVGGYAKEHAEGRIILFIRHARRPERSWFTLNVNVDTKTIIQNHGYGNEYAHGRRLNIPREVQEFVKLWQEKVLKTWQLEPIRQETNKGNTGRKRKAATAA